MKIPAQKAGGSRGFTLLEALMGVLVIAITAALAIPAFSLWLPEYRLKAAGRELLSNFQLAKMTAIKKGSYCTVCFNQAIASKAYDYVIFVDSDSDLEYDPGEETIVNRRWEDEDAYKGVALDLSKGGGDGLTFSANDEGKPAIAFLPSGVPTSNSGGLGMGTAYLRNGKGQRTKVVVSSAGNVRLD